MDLGVELWKNISSTLMEVSDQMNLDVARLIGKEVFMVAISRLQRTVFHYVDTIMANCMEEKWRYLLIISILTYIK